MQKNASPCSCVATYLPESADVVAEVLGAGRLDAARRSAFGLGIATTLNRIVAANGSPELLIVMGGGATPDQTEHVLARLRRPG